MSSIEKRAVIKVSGLVQGVFFRYNTKKMAEKLGLNGFVKNEPDGSVCIVAEGKENNLKNLIKWCYNGSRLAVVEKVDISWEEAREEFTKFEIR